MGSLIPDLIRPGAAAPGFDAALPWLLGLFLIGYLFGSLPSGIIVAKLFGLGDLRQIGSGNIGATNVLRTGDKRAAALTLLFDMGKGAVAVLAGYWLFGLVAAQFAGLGAMLGHLFPVWLRFRGGKGVATFLGVTLGLHFLAGLAACATWLVAAFFFRISSLSALIASLLAPLFVYFFGSPQSVWVILLLTLLVWIRHHANIARLLEGSEPKIGQGKS